MPGAVSRIVAAILIGAAGQAAAAHNYSDHWGATNGATLSIVQHGSSIVVTGHLYDTDRQLTGISFGGTLDENDSFSGVVVQNLGDVPSNNWVSNWNPYVVGSATVRFTSTSQGTFTLTLNGTTTTGTIFRATIGKLPLAGSYTAAAVDAYANCSSRPNRIETTLGLARVVTTDSGDAMTLSLDSIDGRNACTFYVPLRQRGSLATGSGSFVCNDGTSGDVAVEGLRAFDDIVTIRMKRTYRTGETCIADSFLSGVK